VSAIIAVAIHVVIVVVLFGHAFALNFASRRDLVDDTASEAGASGVTVKPIWHTHTLVIDDENYMPLDSARGKDLIGDRMKVTTRRGAVTFAVPAGDIFVVRVTRRGYKPLLARLPNEVSEAGARTIVLHRAKPKP